jgi:uncharacterized membrane protein
MSPTSVRSIRRSVRWFTLKEYVGGALWMMPSAAALVALAAGYGISRIDVRPDSRLGWLAFQGTADDARALLITISSTVVTVIALVLGLTVVALQMLALLRLFETVAEMLPPGSARLAVLDRAAVEALADAERSIPREPSLERVRAAVKALRRKINSRRSPGVEGTQPRRQGGCPGNAPSFDVTVERH